MISWRRPSNRSRRLTGPSGPSKRYSFSTAIHGIRRRLAASASRARVSFFSSTSNSLRAASHSCGDTIGGVFIVPVLPQILVDDVAQATPQRACAPSSPSLRSAHRARARASGSGSDRTAQHAGLLEPGVSGNVRRWCTRRLAWSASLQATSRAQSRSLLYSARSPLAITDPPGLCREDAEFELVGGES